MQLPDFDPIDPGESEILGFDFADVLATGETPSSTSWAIQTSVGTDSSASSRLIGSASVVGTISQQRVGNCLAGVKYTLVASVVTSAGNTLSLWSHLACNRLS
jgi:hypothetical protein